MEPSAALLPGQHSDVTPDFIFGQLAASEATVRELTGRLNGVSHEGRIAPRRPAAADVVTVTTTTGPGFPAGALWLYYTTDGSRPDGDGGRARNGSALSMTAVGPRWDELLWDYLVEWTAEIPPQPAGTYVRYQIEALPLPGSGRSPVYADADAVAAGGPAPVFSYLVDAPVAPAWIHSAVLYHIFVDRFAPGSGAAWQAQPGGRGIMGGTLRGITEHLDYIADLGADTLWLSPIFASPSYHRYDPSDLFHVDPRLGTNDDLHTLVAAAHGRALRVLLDIVPNHISVRHPYFQAAQTDPRSPYRDWFYFTNWPNDYLMFYSARAMPKLNLEHPDARAWYLSSVRYWIEEHGVDGYRLAHVLGPSHDFFADYYRTIKAVNPDSYSVGEATHGAATMRSYEGRMDGVLDFGFLANIRALVAFNTLRLSAFDRFVEENSRYFDRGFANPTFLDNHDMNRFLWVARGDVRRLRLAAAIQFTLPPPPIIYYGTEVGIRQQADVRTAGMGGDAQARGPMLWGADQDADLLAYYRRLIQIRRGHPAVWEGERTRLTLDDATGAYAYAHTAPGRAGLVTLLNLSTVPQLLRVVPPAGSRAPAQPQDVLNGVPVQGDGDELRASLPPLSAALVALEPTD